MQTQIRDALLAITLLLAGLVVVGFAKVVNGNGDAEASITRVMPIAYDPMSEWCSAKITVRNSGYRRLLARTEDLQCGCALKSPTMRIEPNSQQEIVVPVYSDSIRDQESLTILVKTNAPNQKRIEVTLPISGTQVPKSVLVRQSLPSSD